MFFGKQDGWVYKIKPKMEHIGCLIELLSRPGYLDQVERVINIVPSEERLVTYKTLLTACMTTSETGVRDKVADKLLTKLGSSDHAVYVLLSNFYALMGGWLKVEEMRKMMREFSMRKEPGVS